MQQRKSPNNNKWTNGTTVIVSATRPAADFYPMYAKSRIHAARLSYTPYATTEGDSTWVWAANRAMADHTRGLAEKRGLGL